MSWCVMAANTIGTAIRSRGSPNPCRVIGTSKRVWPGISSRCLRVHVSRFLDGPRTGVPAVGPLGGPGLTCPAPALSEAGGPSAPGGIVPGVREPRCHEVPAACGVRPRQRDGLRARLTGEAQLSGQPPGRPGGVQARRSRRLRAGGHVGGRGEAGGEGRGQPGRMQEGFQRARRFGRDGLEAVPRRVEPDPAFHFPAHPGAVAHLPWPDAWRARGPATTRPVRRVETDQAHRYSLVPG